MFPHDYFAAGLFVPSYFPPIVGVVPPDQPAEYYGYPTKWRRPLPPIEPDDDEFWAWFT